MKTISKFWYLLIIPALFFSLVSCDRGDDPGEEVTIPTFTLLKDQLLTKNMDLDKIIMSPNGVNFVAGAPADADLAAFLAKYYIMDIRQAADFANGHIQGAVNVPFANILTEATKAGTKPILVVCYTGQTACYAVGLLRLSDYRDAQALKWGMSGWNPATANAWNNAVNGNPANGHANWAYDAAPTNKVFSNPELTSFSQDGAQILKDRIAAVVAGGFKTVTNGDVLANPANYHLNNYFNTADYTNYGHIKGAYRINPLLLIDNSYLGLDPSPNVKVATYCYTGQTSAIISAYLNVLGFNAFSTSFGMNGLWNSNPAWGESINKWTPARSKNLPLVK
jgi:rhodanese-related sulfurtransferase